VLIQSNAWLAVLVQLAVTRIKINSAFTLAAIGMVQFSTAWYGMVRLLFRYEQASLQAKPG